MFGQDYGYYIPANKKSSKTIFPDPRSLAEELTCAYNDEHRKVEAIFEWITENISYKVNRYVPGVPVPLVEDTGALKPLDERVAIDVLHRREAICDGYARLFKTLCDYAGLTSVVVHGYARTNYGRRGRFAPNHSWNAVQINGEWKLLDVTWAAGYIDASTNRYIPRRDDQYFLTDPRVFLRDHYPEDIQWTLLNSMPVQQEYNKSPFIHAAFRKNFIISYSPAKGIIKANLGDTVLIEVESLHEGKQLTVTTKPDTAVTGNQGYFYLPVMEKSIKKGVKNFHPYILNDATAQWLYVIYNGDIIMRYRLQIQLPPQQILSKKVP